MDAMMDSHSAPEACTTCPTNKNKKLAIAAAVAVVALGWYLFRPELLFVNSTVNESFPEGASTMAGSPDGRTTAQGMFHAGAHDTQGTAAIHELTGGKRVLRLTGFETSNGPDVHVLLGKAADATDSEMVKSAGYVDLGSLKGNIGDQNYEIPADVKLDDYKSVTIWCNRFSVNFGTAPLAAR